MTVMRGLDPRIHQKKSLSKEMDCRVKPGNDDLSEWRPLCPLDGSLSVHPAFTFQPLLVCNKP
jgi:hypothetical protein